MGKLLINIKSSYKKMSKTEKKIADYLLHNSGHTPMNITDLSKMTGASEATIVRFSKKMGCDGYQQLKLLLAKEENHIVNKSINSNDEFVDIYSKVIDDVYSSFLKTKSILNNETLHKSYDMIDSSSEIVLLGFGNSYSLCLDFYHKLLRLGYNAYPVDDSHLQIISAVKATNKSLFICISHSGYTKDIIDAASIAHEHGAKVLTITSDTKSPLAKRSDLVLETVSDEINYRLLGLSSRYISLAIFDTIYSYIAIHKEKSQETIEEIEDVIIAKRQYGKKKRIQ